MMESQEQVSNTSQSPPLRPATSADQVTTVASLATQVVTQAVIHDPASQAVAQSQPSSQSPPANQVLDQRVSIPPAPENQVEVQVEVHDVAPQVVAQQPLGSDSQSTSDQQTSPVEEAEVESLREIDHIEIVSESPKQPIVSEDKSPSVQQRVNDLEKKLVSPGLNKKKKKSMRRALARLQDQLTPTPAPAPGAGLAPSQEPFVRNAFDILMRSKDETFWEDSWGNEIPASFSTPTFKSDYGKALERRFSISGTKRKANIRSPQEPDNTANKGPRLNSPENKDSDDSEIDTDDNQITATTPDATVLTDGELPTVVL